MQETIQAAKKRLVDEKVLRPGVMHKKITPAASHEAENYDWRYLSAATLFK